MKKVVILVLVCVFIFVALYIGQQKTSGFFSFLKSKDRDKNIAEKQSTKQQNDLPINLGETAELIKIDRASVSAQVDIEKKPLYRKKVDPKNISKYGIHLLFPHEIDSAHEFFSQIQEDKWHFIIVMLPYSDLIEHEKWQKFFDKCATYKIIPIIRLMTRYDESKKAWVKPTRFFVIREAEFLNSLIWPTDTRYILLFNEPNHKKEWGGVLDPDSYTDLVKFAANWFHTEKAHYFVLLGAVDWYASDTKTTMNAKDFYKKMYEADPDVFNYVDAIAVHSYTQSDFTASPFLKTEKSMYNFVYLRDFIKKLSGKEFDIYITETGWKMNHLNSYKLKSYYKYALKNIYNKPYVKAVIPFLLNGSPGPYEKFSFYINGQKTKQYFAYLEAIKYIIEKENKQSNN